MGFFDFLAILVGAIVFLVVLVICIDLWQKRQARLAQERYFESQKPRILEAMELLDQARSQIPFLASQKTRSVDSIFQTNLQLVRQEMSDQFELVVSGCRMQFGDYVTKMALLNLGMDEYVYHTTNPVLKGMLGTRF